MMPTRAVFLGREAVELLHKYQLAGGSPSPANLIVTWQNLSIDLEATGDFNAAAGMSERAVGIAQRLAAGNPANAGEVVANLTNYARQLRAAGRPDAARRAEREAKRFEIIINNSGPR